MDEKVLEKLKVLAESAKYDVSCASSGTSRKNQNGGIGSAAGWGICHSFAEDGRCISLLKIMLTNYCMFDCAYCINRRSNDIPRATLTVTELVNLTIEFYRRNYIEGLFLSSGVVRNAAYTMERVSFGRCVISSKAFYRVLKSGNVFAMPRVLFLLDRARR